MNYTSQNETDDGPKSHCSVALLGGGSIGVWTCPQTSVSTDTSVDQFPELALSLAPMRLVVVGRASGQHTVPYLDPAYRSTQLVPGTEQSVLLDDPADTRVSRGHFTLRGGTDGGVVFTNGVPAVGGGVRPPMNGTWLLAPSRRFLDPGEEMTISYGETMVIWLPNGCTLQLAAR